MTDELQITQIVVEGRHRTDLGDLRDLMASIATVGLLHPIVVNAERELVAGARRLVACKQLGWTKVPVTVATSAACARDLLIAERDENTCRLDMKPSEKVSLGLALEAIERPLAQQRKREGARRGGKREEADRNVRPASQKHHRATAEIVGRAVGLSGTSYIRAKRVVREAGKGNPVASEALAEMDSTGRITPAYSKLAGATNPPGSRKKKRLLRDVLEPLRIYLREFDETRLGGLTPAEARRLLAKLEEIERGLFDLHRALENKSTTSRALD